MAPWRRRRHVCHGLTELYPEDGPAVGGGDSFRSGSMKRLWRVCYTGRVLLFHHR
jgi:hypothetical protein